MRSSASPTTFRLRPFPSTALGRRTFVVVVVGSAFVAVLAQIAIPLPFTPVPVTGQTLAVLLVGALAGPRLGVLALAAYLVEGLAGLPVFAGGTSAWSPTRIPGVVVIAGPTLGYLVGFVVAAGVVGWLLQHPERSAVRTLVAMTVGQVIIYVFGVAWLLRYLPADALWASGIAPFVVGDALKIGVATLAVPTVRSSTRGESK